MNVTHNLFLTEKQSSKSNNELCGKVVQNEGKFQSEEKGLFSIGIN